MWRRVTIDLDTASGEFAVFLVVLLGECLALCVLEWSR